MALKLRVIHLYYGSSKDHQCISLTTSNLAAAMIDDNSDKYRGLLGYGSLFLIIKYLSNDISVKTANLK